MIPSNCSAPQAKSGEMIQLLLQSSAELKMSRRFPPKPCGRPPPSLGKKRCKKRPGIFPRCLPLTMPWWPAAISTHWMTSPGCGIAWNSTIILLGTTVAVDAFKSFTVQELEVLRPDSAAGGKCVCDPLRQWPRLSGKAGKRDVFHRMPHR